MKGFLNNCDDIPKWELESVRWIDTQEHLGFCFTQLHFNAEQHKPRNCKNIHQQVCPENHQHSQFVFTNCFAALGWGFLTSTEFLLPCAQTETDYCFATDRGVLCIQGSLQTSGLCVFPRDSSHSVAIVFHWFSILEISFAKFGARLCHFCSIEKGSVPHSRFLRHWKVLVPVSPTFSYFPE